VSTLTAADLTSRPRLAPPGLYSVGRRRKITSGIARGIITASFLVALVPLVWVLMTAISRGLARLDVTFFSQSMRNIVGPGGGAIHAIWGTALITAAATVISLPIGLGTAIYLVEYGRGAVPTVIRFLTDVMTGIPSIVAGLFAYAVMVIVSGPGARSGIAGAIALSLLMIPVVIKSSEEMLRLVPGDLREAAIALGSPKRTVISSVVLPSAMSGILAGVMLGVCRIIGETAPLLLVAGVTTSMNLNLFSGRMMTLPVFIYSQWQNKGIPPAAYNDRAWTAALVLIALVLVFNLAARLVSSLLAPRTAKRS